MDAQCPVCHTVYQVPADSSSPAAFDRDSLKDKKFSARTPKGDEYGPVSYDVLLQWFRENRVNAACYIREEGGTEWLPFLEWVQLPGNAISMEMRPGSLPQPVSRSPSAPTVGPYAFGDVPVGMNSVVQYPIPSRGTLVLILGSVSWLLCITWVGTLVIAAVALGVGFKDLSNIKRGETSPRERNLTLIGMWLAGIAMMINCLFIVFMILAALQP